MKPADVTKRSFFKKVAAAVGFAATAGYLRRFLPDRSELIQAINDSSALEANQQKNAWLQKQWVPMTDNEKKQMLDIILDSHNKEST